MNPLTWKYTISQKPCKSCSVVSFSPVLNSQASTRLINCVNRPFRPVKSWAFPITVRIWPRTKTRVNRKSSKYLHQNGRFHICTIQDRHYHSPKMSKTYVYLIYRYIQYKLTQDTYNVKYHSISSMRENYLHIFAEDVQSIFWYYLFGKGVLKSIVFLE